MKSISYEEIVQCFEERLVKFNQLVYYFIGIRIVVLFTMISFGFFPLLILLAVPLFLYYRKKIKFYLDLKRKALYSYDYLLNSSEMIKNELNNAKYDVDRKYVITDNYFIDLDILSVFRYDEVKVEGYKFCYIALPFRSIIKYACLVDKDNIEYRAIIWAIGRFVPDDEVVYNTLKNRCVDAKKDD